MPPAPGPPPISVVIVDDEDVIRRLLRVNLEIDARFEVLAEAHDGETGLGATLALKPKVLVLDLMMPGVHGADVLQEVRERCPDTKIAMFTAATIAVAASLTGDEAHAYICKTDDIRNVVDTLARLGGGERMTVEHARGRIVELPRFSGEPYSGPATSLA